MDVDEIKLKAEISRVTTEARKQASVVEKLEKEQPSLPMIIGR